MMLRKLKFMLRDEEYSLKCHSKKSNEEVAKIYQVNSANLQKRWLELMIHEKAVYNFF